MYNATRILEPGSLSGEDQSALKAGTMVEAAGANALEEVLRRLPRAYADVLRRQRTTSSTLVYWQAETRRSHEFVWIGGTCTDESLMRQGKPIRVDRASLLFDSV